LTDSYQANVIASLVGRSLGFKRVETSIRDEQFEVICYYRDGKFSHAHEETTLRIGDEIVILTHSKNIPTLQKRWLQKQAQE